MKLRLPTPPAELAIQGEHEANLVKWLLDPRSQEFFGTTFTRRAAVLAAVVSGRSLAAVAREHGISKQAAWKQGQRAKAAFGVNLRLTSKQS
jgi:hypothetical protein